MKKERQVHTTCIRLAFMEFIYDQFSCTCKPGSYICFCSTTILESCLSVFIIIMSHRLPTWALKEPVGLVRFRISMWIQELFCKICEIVEG